MAINSIGLKRGHTLSAPERLLWLFVWGCVLVFVLWPVTAVLRESFLQDGELSLAAWRGLFGKNWRVTLNSFSVAFSVTLITTPLALLLALKLLYCPGRAGRVLAGALVLSTISPPFACSMAYLMLFGRRGLITWRLLGLEWNPYGFHGIVIMESLSLLGIASLLIAASFRQVDGALERASMDLGATPLNTLMQVSIPLALPGIGLAALLVFVRSLSDFGTPLFLGGAFQVLASRAYTTLIGVGDFALACAMNALLLIPALVLLSLRRAGQKNYSPRLAQSRSLVLTGWAHALCGAAGAGFILLQVLVYGMIFMGSVTKVWGVDFSLTSEHLASLWNFRGDSFARSVLCSLAAGIGGAVFGVVLARLIDQTSPWLRRVAETVSELPYLLPGTFFGVGYLLVSSSLPWEIPAGFLIGANCLFRQLSPSLKCAQAGLEQLNPELELAAHDLGGGSLTVLKDIIFPSLRPFMLVSFINSFSASMMSTGPIIFLVSPYAKVASIELFDSINSNEYGAAAAMASLLILAVLAVNAAAWFAAERRR